MSEIKILHLFSNLMSLYGEYGNIAILSQKLTQGGHSVTVDKCDTPPDDLSQYDLVYIGSGTEDDIIEASKRLNSTKEAVKASMETDTQWLVTGNAMALLGNRITYGSEVHDALGVFDFDTVMEREKRWLSDALTDDDTIGYINTSSVYEGIINPAFTLALGADLGNDKKSAADGIKTDNLLATQLIGPLLVKNPHILKNIYLGLTGEELVIDEDDQLNLAYQSARAQLKK